MLLASLAGASSASAIVLTGPPSYTPPNGGSCTLSGQAKSAAGGVWTCSVTPANYSNIYIGIKNDNIPAGTTPFGEAMRQNNQPAGAEIFTWSSEGANTIVYTGQTTIFNDANQAAFTRITLTFSGTGAIVDDATTQALSNSNGAVHSLWRITAGSFTVTAKLEASDSAGGPWTAALDYFGTTSVHGKNTRSGVDGDLSHVDIAFYYSTCGDALLDNAGTNPEQCDSGSGVNGTMGSCCTAACQFKLSGNVCRTSAGVCDPQETCTGASGTCPGDAKSTALCRASAGTCDLADFCDGVNNACPADAKSTAVCRGSAGTCDLADSCDGVNDACPTDAKSTALCRGSGGVCDIAENCDGVNNACPMDAKSTALCRASGGVCDVAESCDGVNNACPMDAKSTASCRASAGVCDLADSCDGVNNNCPADAKSTAVCRGAAGACDVAEDCDGSNDDCPADTVHSSGFVCNPGSGDGCDQDEVCDGSSTACPTDTVTASGTVCRAGSGDSCDLDETCTGVADQPCPADVVQLSGTVCRAGSGDVCDSDETCSGTAGQTCPADVVTASGTVCRTGSGDSCDPNEACTGTAGQTCPTDSFASGSTVCRSAAGPCDAVENCPGVPTGTCQADLKQLNGTPCRLAVDTCDVTEACDGVSDACPVDDKQPDGTSCTDGLFCNGDETCQTGVCTDGADPCAFTGICSEGMDLCLPSTCATAPQAGCRTAQKNLLLIKNKTFNGSDKLIWKFIKGQATTQADFTNPTATADYALCIYAGVSDTLVASIHVPPSTLKWTPLGSVGYKYLDFSLAADGTQKVTLKGTGVAGKTKALVKGRGDNLPDPLDGGPLPLPITAQWLNYQSGVCWEGNFSTALKNSTTLFKAKNP